MTVLKAWFDESTVLADPVVPTADGTALVPYTGPDAGRLTVGGELDKLASNISLGRNMGGVHWRTDAGSALLLGEEVAIGILRETLAVTHERASLTVNRLDGTNVTI